ncbi:ribosomal RNA-processing protein 7-domain-containing protein [Boletus edulis BED1]|uniref:Ribosomal RNA-processing protein 7-domain-containing protein n=1 Tax=Boletus edulis BED1 TaxID=1328754 RepID=A0AAD4GJ75_BOLED|nr:ribosomal RNA-processing protein 7-domain-containing protein [Boletus edulis BED1]
MSTLVSGFTVIPVAYARSTHILYARAHLSKSQDVVYPEKRTLFLVNIPVDATDREITLFFKSCGTVERVVYNRDSRDEAEAEAEEEAETEADIETSPPLSPSPSSQNLQPRSKRKQRPTESASSKCRSIAHVIFLDTSSLEKALVPPTKPRPWPSSSEEPRGLAHYAALYDAQRPPLDVVKAHADTWMERFEFDLARTKQKVAYRKGEAIVDDDGFTLVTRGGAYGQTLGGGVGVASKAFEKTSRTGSKKKKKPEEKETFYAFQKAEKQRKALLDLRRNFEADKARIDKMKESRRFKPY